MTARSAARLALGCIVGPFMMAPASVAAPASVVDRSRPPVIVIGVPDLRWDQLSSARTPVLWQLAAGSALGALSVKAADRVSCPADGWLTLGAGNRASAGRIGTRWPMPALARLVSQHPRRSGRGLRATAQRQRRAGIDATQIGALADALVAAGQCVSAAGGGAALAAADSRGQIASYRANAQRRRATQTSCGAARSRCSAPAHRTSTSWRRPS